MRDGASGKNLFVGCCPFLFNLNQLMNDKIKAFTLLTDKNHAISLSLTDHPTSFIPPRLRGSRFPN
jgi:hypothetical protein